LLAKKPVSVAPISRKPLAFRRPFWLGFNSLLKEGKIELGIAPRDEAFGGGCGGSAVGGGECEGLNTLYSNRPKAYASAAAGSDLDLCQYQTQISAELSHSFKVDHPLFLTSGGAYAEEPGNSEPIVCSDDEFYIGVLVKASTYI
jgi:hypothetical protein